MKGNDDIETDSWLLANTNQSKS